MTTVEDALANTLRLMREHKGYTQESVARSLGTSSANISRWETSGPKRHTISPTNLYLVSSLYESTPSTVYELASSEITLDDLISKPKKGNNGNSNKVSSKKKKK